MRKFLLLLLLSGMAAAQSTTVSTTGVVDTDGDTWTNGSYQITFVPNPTHPSIPSYIWTGGNLIANSVFTGSLNASGQFSVSIPDNTTITPSGSSWRFTICPNASAGCFSTNIAVNGATFNITSQLNLLALGPRFPVQFGARGYADVNILPIPLPGGSYYNTTSGTTRLWTGTGWTDLVATSGIIPNPAVTQTITQPINTNFDVVTSGTGQFLYNGSQVLTAASLGSTAVLFGPSGSQTVTQPANTNFNVVTSGTGTTHVNSLNNVLYAQSGSNIGTLCSGFTGLVEVTVPLTVSSNTAIPVTCTVRVENGGIISIGSGATLTFNGAFESGIYQAFSGSGSVVFGANSTDGIYPQWWGALANGSNDDAPAIQSAFDTAANSTVKLIKLSPGNYFIDEPINVTSSSAINHSAISVSYLGRRGAVTITGNTYNASTNPGGIMFDLSGTAWTTWDGLFLQNSGATATNASWVGFFIAPTTNTGFTEALHNNFNKMVVQLYKTTPLGTFGTVGYMFVGAEENTLNQTETNATTPFVLTTTYSIVSGSYTSPFLPSVIAAAHSLGVTTFSGENSTLTFDSKGSNFEVYGANTIDFGNIYCSDQDIGTPGSAQAAVVAIGGTMEGWHGHFKIEGRSAFLYLNSGQIFGMDVSLAFGAIPNDLQPSVLFNTASGSAVSFVDSRIDVIYVTPEVSPFVGKPVFATTGTPNFVPQLANIDVSVNQTIASFGLPPWPAWMVGPLVNGTMKMADVTLKMSQMEMTKTNATPATLIGMASSTTGVQIGTLHLPPIVSGFSASSFTVRVTGQASIINPVGGNEVIVASVPIDTQVGAVEVASGAVTVGGSPSDNLFPTTANSSVSTLPASILLNGINVQLTYNSGPRTITITAYPLASGSGVSTTSVWLYNAKIDVLFTQGHTQQLNYLSN
jgi:hypothetical protein